MNDQGEPKRRIKELEKRMEASEAQWRARAESVEQRLRAELELAQDYADAVIRSRSAGRRIVGESVAIREVLRLVQSVAGTTASVLICGERGVGKGIVAESIHRASRRAGRPFVAVNCVELRGDLLESELFGHKQGALAAADRDRRGLAEIADGGTLLVHEVGDMAPAIQGKLLRLIEHGAVRRTGYTDELRVDVRVIAATSRDLRREVRNGRFREDLLYRLGVVCINVPPLRDRKADIPLIAGHLLGHSGVALQKPKRLAAAALDALVAYDWPGNIGELSNVLDRAIVLSGEADEIGAEHLALSSARTSGAVRPLRELERDEIAKALALTKGNKTEAARMLGIARQTLVSRLQRQAIERGQGESPSEPSAV